MSRSPSPGAMPSPLPALVPSATRRSAPGRGRWAPVLALSVACAALATLWTGAASACFSASNTHSQVLGVSRDGSSAWYQFTTSEALENDISAFFLLDPAGRETARIEWEKRESKPGGGSWASSGAIDWSEMGRDHHRPASVDSITAEIQRRYELTPLRVSGLPMQVNPQGPGCGRAEVRAPEGPVTLIDIGPLSYYNEGHCSGLGLSLFEHPNSAFHFVHITYFVPVDQTAGTRFDGFQMIPRSRLTGGRAAARGRSAQLRGDLGAAIALYDEALKLAPEYVAPRLWAAQAAVAAHWTPESGLAFLELPFPDNQPCVGEEGAKLGEWLDHDAPSSWRDLRGPSAPTPWDVCEGRPLNLHSSWEAAERPPAEPLPLIVDVLDPAGAPKPSAPPPPVVPAEAATAMPAAPGTVSILDALKISVMTSFLTAFALGYLDRRRNRPRSSTKLDE